MGDKLKLYDAIIIGAGISGLYTARCLIKEGLDVLVLEARNRVGGRTLTHRDAHCQYADMGGAYVGPQQTKIISLVKELGMELYNVPTAGKSVLYSEGSRLLYTEEELPIKYLMAALDLNNAYQCLDQMSLEVSLLEPWRAEKAEEWDKISLSEFIDKLCWTSLTHRLLSIAAKSLYLHSCDHTSLLLFLHEIRSSGGTRALFSSVDGLQAMKIKGGSSSVSEKLAEQLGDRVLLNSPVRCIDQRGKHVEITTKDDRIYKARQVVVAMCPPVLQNIEVLPPLPDTHQAYINHMAECDGFKTIMYYKEAYWEKKGLRGEFVCLDGIAYYGLPDTKPDGSLPAIMGFLDGSKCGQLSKEERKQQLCHEYARLMEIPEMKNPIHYLEYRWGDQEEDQQYTGICVYSVPPGFLTKYRELWGESCDRIHFAGTEATPVMHGYMDGGLRAAETATVQVLNSLERTPQQTYDRSIRTIPYLPYPTYQRCLPSIPQFWTVVLVLGGYLLMYIFGGHLIY